LYENKCEYGSIVLDDELSINFGYHLYENKCDHLYENKCDHLYENKDNDEKICSLIFDSGGHGTHVAGIIGSYFEDNPTMNGVNPNVKFISLKIGDSEIDGMETSIALVRALHEIVKYKCHLVNYSFGEPVGNKKGRFMEMLNEYIYKYNINYVSSAGNSGPNITTIGAPSTITNRTICVGAYTNKEYLKNLYFSSDNNYEEGCYEWSSRGPNMNNSMGIDIIATGCALTSHPKWYSSDLRMCNGTSMASPNTTGFLSLILSQFDENNYPHPYWVKKYLESTCEIINNDILNKNESFSQGRGLIGQNYIKLDYFNNKEYYYELKVSNNKDGIVNYVDVDDIYKNKYIITLETKKINNYVERNTNNIISLVNNNSKYIKCPNKIVSNKSTKFSVLLDNDINISSYVDLYEENINKLISYVPINQFIYKDLNVNKNIIFNNKIESGKIERLYIRPKGNILKFSTDDYISEYINIDIIQIYEKTRYDYRSFNKYLSEKSNSFVCNVIPNTITEICIYTSWKSLFNENVKINIECLKDVITIEKNLYEPNERISVILDKHHSNKDIINEKFSINGIVSKYYPIKTEYIELDDRYIDKDNKKLKKLRLTYIVNKHSNTFHYINTNNKIYDSKLYMSGCITGYDENNKKVFYANYTQKKVKKPVKKITIDFIDNDDKILNMAKDTILTCYRDIQKPIVINTQLTKGVNYINIPYDKIKSLKQIYDGDYIQGSILNKNTMIIYRNIKQKETNKTNIFTELLKDFTYIKVFINNLLDNIIFNNIENIDNIYNEYIDKYKDKIDNFTHRELLDYKFIKLLLTNNTDKDIYFNILKTINDDIIEYNLIDKKPYNILKLGMKYNKLDDNINDILNILESINNSNYWNNFSIDDINMIRRNLIDKLTDNDKKYLLHMKQKLLEYSAELVVF
jgi:hypothetical protein